jgi:hypothetical protein
MELTPVETQVERPLAKSKGRQNARPKLDGRTNATKFLTALTARVEEELGDRLGIVERGYIDGYCGTCLLVQNLTTRLARGEQIDFSEYTQACQNMMSFASLLGLKSNKQHVEA